MFARAYLTGRGSRCRPPKASGPPRDSSAGEADGSNPHNNDPEKLFLYNVEGFSPNTCKPFIFFKFCNYF